MIAHNWYLLFSEHGNAKHNKKEKGKVQTQSVEGAQKNNNKKRDPSSPDPTRVRTNVT